MLAKTLEVRDSATFIPVLAFKLEAENPIQGYYIHRRSGWPFDGSMVCVMRLADCEAHGDPYNWGSSRTMKNAHKYIEEHFYELTDGDVVDVRVILGEEEKPAISERFEHA